MTTNPNQMVRVRARNGGRASVYEANAWAQAFGAGVMDGNGVRQNTSADMNVLVGGTTSKPDVVIASNPAGYKIALDIVETTAIAITAPAANKRIASVVAYTDDLSIASTETSITGSPASCGLIVVNGATSANPVAPDDATIRAAITADGATGTQASYAVLANITVSNTTSIITNSLISKKVSGVTSPHVDFTTFDNFTISGETWADATEKDVGSPVTITKTGRYVLYGRTDRTRDYTDDDAYAITYSIKLNGTEIMWVSGEAWKNGGGHMEMKDSESKVLDLEVNDVVSVTVKANRTLYDLHTFKMEIFQIA